MPPSRGRSPRWKIASSSEFPAARREDEHLDDLGNLLPAVFAALLKLSL